MSDRRLAQAIKYRPQIWGRLMAEKATDLSDETIEAILGSCVCGSWLVPCAKALRENGLIELVENPPYARG